MLAIRLIPNAGVQTLYANGRTYPVAGTAYVDIPFNDGFAIGPDQAYRLMVVGTTADRQALTPNSLLQPRHFYDLTLGKMVFYVPNMTPAQWVDITGAAV